MSKVKFEELEKTKMEMEYDSPYLALGDSKCKQGDKYLGPTFQISHSVVASGRGKRGQSKH